MTVQRSVASGQWRATSIFGLAFQIFRLAFAIITIVGKHDVCDDVAFNEVRPLVIFAPTCLKDPGLWIAHVACLIASTLALPILTDNVWRLSFPSLIIKTCSPFFTGRYSDDAPSVLTSITHATLVETQDFGTNPVLVL